MARTRQFFFFFALCATAFACGGARTTEKPCQTDAECGAGRRCSAEKVCVAGGGGTLGQACSTALDCTTGEKCEGGFCATNTDGSCAIDADCAASQFCDDGTCTERDVGTASCSRHDDCPLGNFCRFGSQECVDCLNNDHCPAGEICLGNGVCGVEGSNECTTSLECNGQVCNAGECVPCLTGADCDAGETCRDNQCVVADGGNPVCSAQSDCEPFGYICDTGLGRCQPCASSAQCGAGNTCNNGVCQSSTGGGGGGGSNAECESRDDCNGVACFLGICSPCSSDFMCAELADIINGAKICDVSSGTCIDAQCIDADDCPAGEACWGAGHCGECLFDDECRLDEVCDTDLGVCEPFILTECTTSSSCTQGEVCISNMCEPCTSSTQCSDGETCQAGACVQDQAGGNTNTGALVTGEVCITADDQCGEGFCLDLGGVSKCTRSCVGSGAGALDDCPSGMGCRDFASGGLDGLKLCVGADQVSATFPGTPFTTSPGGACSATANACQTSICMAGGTCAQGCLANADCGAGDVCYAYLDGSGVATGYHLCAYSDTLTFQAAGTACTSNGQCDSGVCAGTCSDTGDLCGDNSDCGVSGTCQGTCVNHCRTSSDCSTGFCGGWPMVKSPRLDHTPVCLPGGTAGPQALNTACTLDSQCQSQWCIGGFCTTPCGTDDDCSALSNAPSCGPVGFVDADDDPVYAMHFCMP